MKNKKIISAAIVAAGLFVLLGIAALEGESDKVRLSPSAQNLMEQYHTSQNSDVLKELPQSFFSSYANFSVDLLKGSRSSGENTMVSPASVITALTMAENGARGETLAEMQHVMASGMEQSEWNQNLSTWLSGLPDSEEAHLSMANSIWVNSQEESFVPREEFLKTNAAFFCSDIYNVPFDDNTLRDINQWTHYYTEGMIKEAFDTIPADAVMYLLNTMAFEAEWKDIYKISQIQEGVFTCENGREETIDMMYSEEDTYLQEENAQGFIKPYADGYCFAVLLPKEGTTLDEYIMELDGETLLYTIQNGSAAAVRAGIPKFEGETSLELKEVLCDMGMPLVFDSANADLSGIGTSGMGNLFISRVIHQTYIKVDERGTKAGAVSVVEVMTEGAMMDVKTVILNRPFLYAIIENDTNLPVFIGTVEDF